MIHAIFLKYHFTKLICFVILTILSLIGFQATAIAQVQDLFRENVLRKYGAEDRLFVDAITEMIQDYEGYIWVSGRGGLCRFDGHEFYQFPNGMEVSHSIRAERVVEVFEDSQHNIWVGTLQGGLKLLDRSSGTFIDFVNADESKRFTSILEVVEDQEGQIWVSSAKGLGKVDQRTQKIEYVPLSYHKAAPYISAITIAESGQLWLGTTNTELLGVDPQTGTTRSIALPWTEAQANGISRIRIKYLLIDRKDRLWMNTSNGLFRAETEDLNTKTEVEWTLMTSKKVMEVAEDKDGNLWISTSSGLLYYDIQKDDFDRDYFSDRGLEELNEVDARNLLFDEQRNLWISTISGEMYQVLWNQIKPRLYPEDSFGNGQLGDFFTLLIDENDLYFGTRPGVLGRFNPYTHQHEILVKIPNQKAHRFANYIKAIYKDQNNQLWLGTKSAGLWIYQLDAKQLISFEQYFGDELAIIPHSPQCIAGDQEGNILISCLRNGLMKYNPKDQSIKKIDCSEDMEGSCMFKKLIPSKTGFIWMLGYYERTKLMKYTSASDSYEVLDTKKLGGKREQFTDIRTIFEDRQANLWLGTDKGLFRLDQVQNNFIHYGNEVGLPETSVLAIQEDQKGQLWIASNRGIYAFDRTKNISTPVNTYISSFTFQHDSYFIHPETQQLFSANAKGLWAIYLPQTNNIGHTSYHAVFSKATYNYKGEESSEIDLFINEKSKIKIPHRAVGVEFQLTTLDHASSEYINYKYALQKRGFSPKPLQPSDWTNLQGQNKINLASLSAGHYILHVKASTQLGNWDAEVKQLRIHKLPPWWQSNWAYAIYINLLIFLIYKVYKYQLNRQY
ncbi:MAG: two-component regulator propeller domain-containing protein, partial [Bacteroidota bacterium]